MLSDGSNFQIEENNNPEEVGTLGHLLAAVRFQLLVLPGQPLITEKNRQAVGDQRTIRRG